VTRIQELDEKGLPPTEIGDRELDVVVAAGEYRPTSGCPSPRS
jgi:hypothetical protein